MNKYIKKWTESSLILKIIGGLIIGSVLGILVPQYKLIGLPGELFVTALKAIAPILVFILVASALSRASEGIGSRFKTVIVLYLFSTFLSAMVAVTGSYLFPVGMHLTDASDVAAPGGLGEVISSMLLKIFANPLQSLSQGDYLGILFWAIVIGLCLKKIASDSTLDVFSDLADATSLAVRGIIQFAPIGIMGLVFSAVSESGLSIFIQYGQLVLLLVGCIATVAFVTDPIIAAFALRRNPYPLVLTCLKESGITAFFTRSSAANIPVNMRLCERLGLDKDFYSISIPLGSTINMEGAAVTITVMTLAVCHTLGISVDLPTTIVLCIISTLAACGSSGVAGGSLLLIPMACSLFGIPSDISMQAIAVGFIIGVVQDSCETALNSSGDALFSATAEYHDRVKRGEDMNFLGEFAKDKAKQ
ncbi:transporter SDF family [Methanobrevibacter ruminantium M1]|uniref:Transporter SDF family n=1 Tax=Methanobrevibacter ruminantium (strain ATCC 35063 / DSM 1093 / JCM 13430 / OCM 146 / M1) TaxID=634498 RepID=D3E2S6_METRM|nr:serine/threonine transporter SstT [Methanobrevibacter ruminantium]ADC46837.1 transporter SDF family [Methanobrevibacter ruminantium M1]